MAKLVSRSPDGTPIVYAVTGTGPALMLLHGAGKTRRDWHKAGYVKRLQADFTVITVDLRGSGSSDKPTDLAAYHIDRLVEDVVSVAGACGVERFAIWGYSFGGNVGRYVAARTGRVFALAVIGIPFGAAVDANFDQTIDNWQSEYGPLVDRYNTDRTQLSAQEIKDLEKRNMPVWMACFPAMRGWPDLTPAEVGCPLLLVSGTENRMTMAWIADHQDELDAARAEIAVLDGLSHLQEFSQIDRVFPVVQPFFIEHGR